MSEVCQSSSHIENQIDKARVAAVANRQAGRIAWHQLLALEIARNTVHQWVRQGYLHRVLPRIYAVGHSAPSLEGDLMAAVLYAGPDAALSHTTAAWWWGLIDDVPKVIHVSTPRRCRSVGRIKVHGRRNGERAIHRGLPTSPLPQLFLDLAATTSRRTLRAALASAEYRNLLDVRAVEAAARPGRPGGANLRATLTSHLPHLALTKSRLETRFLELCAKHDLPLPEVNQYVAGWQVDALWPHANLAVELDGYGNHHTPAQLRRDRKKEMALRAAGLTPLRYSEEQLTESGREVIAELRRLVTG